MTAGAGSDARTVLGRRAAILLLLLGIAAAAVGVAWGRWQAARPGGSPVSRGGADPVARILAAAAEAAETAARPMVLDISDDADLDEARVIEGYLALRARLRPALGRIGSLLAKLDPRGMERLGADGRIEFPEAAPGDVPWSSGRFELQGFQIEIRLKPRPDGAAERVLRAAVAPTGTVILFLRDVAVPRRPPGLMLIRWPIR
jgi:hypothetical protein